MHVAFLSNGLFPYAVGGMQKHSVRLVSELPQSGWRVTLFYAPNEAYPSASEIHADLFNRNPQITLRPVEHRRLPYFPGHHYPDCFWLSRTYRRDIRRCSEPFDFVFAQGYMGWASIASRRAGATDLPPVGVNFHGLEALQDSPDLLTTLRNCLAPVWLKWNLRHADCVLSLGGALDDLTAEQGVPRGRILSSFNGISSDWFADGSPDSDHARRLLFVGRDSARKGFTELKTVLPTILRDHNCEVHFAGDISGANRVQHERAVYHGVIRSESELRDLYRSCDVLLCPSHSEGMPTVILEAAACGLPSIATDVGAVRLMVNDETGWLIPARDTAALEHAIRDALSADLSIRSRAAQQAAREFQWDRVAARTVEGIQAFLGQPQDLAA